MKTQKKESKKQFTQEFIEAALNSKAKLNIHIGDVEQLEDINASINQSTMNNDNSNMQSIVSSTSKKRERKALQGTTKSDSGF